jgi:hypothetical protein
MCIVLLTTFRKSLVLKGLIWSASSFASGEPDPSKRDREQLAANISNGTSRIRATAGAFLTPVTVSLFFIADISQIQCVFETVRVSTDAGSGCCGSTGNNFTIML